MTEPRFATPRNLERKTLSNQAALIAKRMNKPLLPWQKLVLDVAMEICPITGLYYYDTVIVTIPRQGGKTTLVGVKSTHRALTKEGARIWYTAQRGKYASDWMKEEHEPLLGTTPLFQGKYRFARSLGSEAIHWNNGSLFKVFPPKRDALHGKQSDETYVDEAWAFDQEKGSELKQAIRPTMITRPDPQLWILSTMGDDQSIYLNDYVDTGRASVVTPGSKIAYFEWSIGEQDDPEDLEVIANAHPAFGYTVTMEALKAARLDFKTDVAGWARAYGNRPTFSRIAAFPNEVWQAAGTEAPDMPKRFGIGFDVTPSGDRATVSASWRDSQGNVWVEVLRDEAGSHWVARYLIQLWEKYRLPIGYDTAGINTLAVADDVVRIGKGKVQLKGLTTTQFASACATVTAAVMNRTFRHSRQAPLNKAIEVASRRPILDGGFAWGRKVSTGSIAPLVSVTVALKVYDELPSERILEIMTVR